MPGSLPPGTDDPDAHTPESLLEGSAVAARQAVVERRVAATLAGRDGDEEAVRAALGDEAPDVRAAALGALVRGGWATPADARRALCDPAAAVRRRACECAPRLPGANYRPLLTDPEPGVVEAAAFACGEQRDRRAVAALSHLAGGHPDPLCREAAVAALGAIGDPVGAPAVLAACTDVPAIRRRAVVALAAFTGEEVEAALVARLEDRDWQVRQAAEDVLGEDAPASARARRPEAGGPPRGRPPRP